MAEIKDVVGEDPTGVSVRGRSAPPAVQRSTESSNDKHKGHSENELRKRTFEATSLQGEERLARRQLHNLPELDVHDDGSQRAAMFAPVAPRKPDSFLALSAFVTEVHFLGWGEKPPPNCSMVRVIGDPAAPTGLSRGVQIWIERSPVKPPVTAICAFYPMRGEFLPPRFTVARSSKLIGDSYFGTTQTTRILLGLCRGDGVPILDLSVCPATHIPTNWTGIERSPLGFKAHFGQRVVRATSNNPGVGLAGGNILCVRYDLSEIQKFRGDDMIRYGRSEGESSQTQGAHARRKSSLIGHIVGSVTPNVKPLRKTGLTRRAATPTPLTSPNGNFSKKSPSEPPSPQPPPTPTSDQEDNSPRAGTFLTRLQRARERALQKTHMEDGLGMNLAFDPEVAGLLVNTDILEKVMGALSSITRGSVLDALLALRDLDDMIKAGDVVPSRPVCEQMTVFDFAVAYGASVAVERGCDILMAPACKIVAEGCREAANGLHPVTLHHTLSVIARATQFFSQLRDEFLSQKVQALTQETYGTSALTVSDSNPTKLDRVGSSERLESLVAKLSGFGIAAGSPQPGVALPIVTGPHDQGFHFLFPAETVDQMFNDRAYVLLQANAIVFQDLCERCSVLIKTQYDDSKMNSAFDRLAALITQGPFNVEMTLEAYLILFSAFEAASPLLDLVLAFTWVTALAASSFSYFSTMLQDLIIHGSRVDSHIIGLTVRRLVFPMLMRHISDAVVQQSDGRDALQLLSLLWRTFRTHLKAEIAVVLRSIVLPCLRSPRAPSELRLRMLELIASWLDADRSCLLELYLNLESDSPVPHWNVFQEFFDALHRVIFPPSKTLKRFDPSGNTKKRFFVHRASSSQTAGHEEESDLSTDDHLSNEAATILVACMRQLVNLSGSVQAGTSKDDDHEQVDAQRKMRETIAGALHISRTQGSAKSAVAFLVAAGYLQETPQAVAQFLRLHLGELGEASVGDYLGEGGKNSTEQSFMVALRDYYVKAAPRNAGDSLDQALRRFLTMGGFRLPGEGQKVERLLEAFARRFWADRPDLDATEEAILILSFSLVMLNTDLHRAEIKQKTKMKKEEFIRNVSGINNGKDFPRELLSDLYDSIARHEIRALKAALAQPGTTTPPSAPDTDESSEGKNSDTALSDKKNDDDDIFFEFGNEDEHSEFSNSLQMSVERALGVLNTLCERHFEFRSELSHSAVRRIFESVSPKTFQVVSSVLEDATTRFELVTAALDTLEYALGVTIFLNLSESDRRAFASLLAKLAVVHGVGETLKKPETMAVREQRVLHGEHLRLQWFLELMSFDPTISDPGPLLSTVHIVALDIADKILARRHEQKLTVLARRLGNPELLSSNSERTFIREGILRVKGRERVFFLFSDCLLRAVESNGSTTNLKVEENLPLRTLRVLPKPSSTEGLADLDCVFEIWSPLSNVVVQASSRRERELWIRDLNQALVACAEMQSRLDIMRSPVSRMAEQPSRKFPSSMSSIKEKPTAVSTSQPVFHFESQPMSPIVVPSSRPAVHPPSPIATLRMTFSAAHDMAKQMLVDSRVDTATKLLIYGYFKQATKGDCVEDELSDVSDDIRKAKWHAWRAHNGMTKDEAMSAFIKVVKAQAEQQTSKHQ